MDADFWREHRSNPRGALCGVNAVNSSNGGCRGPWKREGEPNSGCGAGRMADTSPPWGYPSTAPEDCNSQDQRKAAGCIFKWTGSPKWKFRVKLLIRPMSMSNGSIRRAFSCALFFSVLD